MWTHDKSAWVIWGVLATGTAIASVFVGRNAFSHPDVNWKPAIRRVDLPDRDIRDHSDGSFSHYEHPVRVASRGGNNFDIFPSPSLPKRETDF